VNMSSDSELNYAIQASTDLLRVVVKPRGVDVPPSAPFRAAPFPFPAFGRFGGRGGSRGFHGPFYAPGAPNAPTDAPVIGEQSPFPFRGHGFERFGGRGDFGHRHVERDCNKPSEKAEKADKLVARHVKDVTIPDGTQLVPRVPFVKIWRVRNEGVEWPEGCRLLFVSRHRGDIMGAPEFVPVEGKVAPGAEVDISVNMIAPEKPGHYNGFWKMSTADGKKFGQRLWVSIQVLGASSSSSSDEILETGKFDDLIKQIQEMGFDFPKRKVERLLRKYGGNIDAVAEALMKKAAKKGSERKRH